LALKGVLLDMLDVRQYRLTFIGEHKPVAVR
jgi:hypothetical protein